MAYESEVRRQAGIMDAISKDASRERSKARFFVDGAGRWWKGKGGEAFIEEYQGIDREAKSFLKHLNSAVDGLNRLPSLIQRAERERRAEAERKAAAAKRNG